MGEYDDGSVVRKVVIPPYSIKEDTKESLLPIRDLLLNDDDPFENYRGKTPLQKAKLTLFSVFPIFEWLSTYKRRYLIGDFIGGLTIASLAVPQDLGYAKLANLPPVNGLYSSFVPPLIYAVLGSSRHIAIGPVAVVSLLLGTLLKDEYNPTTQKDLYYQLAITSTFFAGIIQLAMGLLRLGFVIDFLSHAVIIGFMAGAAITIGLSQLKNALGYKTFTTKTDIVSVFNSIVDNSDEFQKYTFTIFIVFLIYLYTLKYLSWKTKGTKIGQVFFFANALGPFTSVVLSTLGVYLSRADKDGVKVVGHIKKGVNPSSLDVLKLSGEVATKGIKVGIVAGLIALTEAVSIARTFAALKGYHIDGNKEMIALGTMNIFGSFTSCYVATGSFSRSAVSYAAGTETALANIIMAVVVLITLVAVTPLFKYLPNSVLASIIIAAVTGLIDVKGFIKTFKTDKFDFAALLGAFFGVLFVSIEIGLLIAVVISALKLLVNVARPHLVILGKVPGTILYRNVQQYPDAVTSPGTLVVRIDANLYYANANFIRERIELWVERYNNSSHGKGGSLQYVILELTPVTDVDTTGVHALEELLKSLSHRGIQLGLSNPSKLVLWRLQTSGFLEKLGLDWLFVSVHEGVKVTSLLRETGGKDIESH